MKILSRRDILKHTNPVTASRTVRQTAKVAIPYNIIFDVLAFTCNENNTVEKFAALEKEIEKIKNKILSIETI